MRAPRLTFALLSPSERGEGTTTCTGYTFELHHELHPDLSGPERLRAFEALPFELRESREAESSR